MSTTLFIIDGRFPGNTMRDPDETSHDEQLIHLKNIHSQHSLKNYLTKKSKRRNHSCRLTLM